MTKNSKRQTRRSEQTKIQSAQVCALKLREAHSLVIGIDLGDRKSWYCVRTLEQDLLAEGSVARTGLINHVRGR